MQAREDSFGGLAGVVSPCDLLYTATKFPLTESWNFGSFLQRAMRSQTDRITVIERASATKKIASQLANTRLFSGEAAKGIRQESSRAPARATVGNAVAHSSIS